MGDGIYQNLTYKQQLSLCCDEDEKYENIWPHSCWTLIDYKDMFEDIDRGFIIQETYLYNWFVVNPEWKEICPVCGDEWTDATRCDCPDMISHMEGEGVWAEK